MSWSDVGVCVHLCVFGVGWCMRGCVCMGWSGLYVELCLCLHELQWCMLWLFMSV